MEFAASDVVWRRLFMEKKKINAVSIRRLLTLARPHIKPLAFATVALFIGSGLSLVYPQAARLGVDDVLMGASKYDWRLLGGGLMVLFLIQAVFVSLRYYLFTIVGERVVADLRIRLFARILAQEVGFFDSTKTGELTSRLTSDTQVLQNAVTSNLSMALRYVTQALGGVIVLFVTSWQLALIMIVSVPAMVLFARYYGRKVRKLSSLVQDRLADSTAIAEESISGVRTVRSFAAESQSMARYDNAVDISFDAARRRGFVGAVFGGVISLFGYGVVALILFFGSRQVMAGEMTVGELTAFLLYTLMVAFALGVLSGLWTDFMKATGSAERVFELIDRVPEQDTTGTNRDAIEGRVSFEDVRFEYPTRLGVQAISNVSFKIEPGRRVAIIGPSGAGKSTLGQLLLRFYDPQAGTIRVDGRDIKEFDVNWLREQMGVVAQEPILFSGTVRDNVIFACPNATDEEVIAALEAANAWDFVGKFPDVLDTVIGERGVRLSGGQKQRIAIARALLKDPAILILDEATSALDVESEALVQRALDRLMEGRTTLIIAHRLSTVATADQVLVLDQGELVEQGTHGELMGRQGVYSRLIESQRLLA